MWMSEKWIFIKKLIEVGLVEGYWWGFNPLFFFFSKSVLIIRVTYIVGWRESYYIRPIIGIIFGVHEF